MICYIKNFKDFRTIAKYDAVAYSLSDGEDGHITIYDKDPVQLVTKYVGCWLVVSDGKVQYDSKPYTFSTEIDENGGVILNITGGGLNTYENPLATGGLAYNIQSQSARYDQYVHYISGCTPSGDSLDLTIKHPIYAFERAVLYDGSTTYGALIRNILNNDYGMNCPDLEYRMNYMAVSSTDNTPCEIETDEFGYIIPSEVFEMARQSGVNILFKNTSINTLEVAIRTANYTPGYVVFGDGHSQLQSESYDASYCAKATILAELASDYHIIDQSEMISGVNNIQYSVEISEEIGKTKDSGKIYLAARFAIKWPVSAITAPEKYTSNKLDIWLGTDTSGTKLLTAAPEWERSPESGNYYTEWFEMSEITDRTQCQLHCICKADGASGTEHTIDFNLEYLASLADIKEGPIDRNSTDAHGKYYRVIDYYLTTDKTISRTPPAIRPAGQWNLYSADASESPLHVAIGAFSGNTDNHKIEFYSDKRFEYYQPMRLRLRGEVMETVITSRTITRTDERYFYKCGNLMTTLTDHVRGLERSTKS